LLAAGVRPPRPQTESTNGDVLGQQQPLEATTTEAQLFAHAATVNGVMVGDGETGTLLQAHKAAFFFKLERELEKVSCSLSSTRHENIIVLNGSVTAHRSTISITNENRRSKYD